MWYLLHHGALPDAASWTGSATVFATRGTLSGAESSAVGAAAAASFDRDDPAPTAAVRSGVSALAGQRSLEPWLERPLDELRAEVLGLSAATAAVVVRAAATLRGRDAPPPRATRTPRATSTG